MCGKPPQVTHTHTHFFLFCFIRFIIRLEYSGALSCLICIASLNSNLCFYTFKPALCPLYYILITILLINYFKLFSFSAYHLVTTVKCSVSGGHIETSTSSYPVSLFFHSYLLDKDQLYLNNVALLLNRSRGNKVARLNFHQ